MLEKWKFVAMTTNQMLIVAALPLRSNQKRKIHLQERHKQIHLKYPDEVVSRYLISVVQTNAKFCTRIVSYATKGKIFKFSQTKLTRSNRGVATL